MANGCTQTFNDFELEAHMECTYDRLEIFDGDDSGARQLGRLCGSGLPNPVVSTGNRLYMTFYTDASVQRKGFDITHTTGTILRSAFNQVSSIQYCKIFVICDGSVCRAE